MALLPTISALLIGSLLGRHWGGRAENLLHWRPGWWGVPVAAIGAQSLMPLIGLTGTPAVLLHLVSLGALSVWAACNIRIGGMVLVSIGLGLNLLVTIINAGMPVSPSALRSAGLATDETLGSIALSSGRHVADGDLLRFLGETIALPTGQVVSMGDLIVLVGLVLVTASLWCRRRVHQSEVLSGARDLHVGLAVLGRGPAPRRGPGLHPSRLHATTAAPTPPAGVARPREHRRPA